MYRVPHCTRPYPYLRLDEVSGVGHDERVLAVVLGRVEVEVVDDGVALLVGLEATLGGQIPEHVAGGGGAGNQHVAAGVHELCDALDGEGAAELLDRGREQDQVVEQELAVLLEHDGGVVGHLVGDGEALVGQRLEVQAVRLLDGQIVEQREHAPVLGLRLRRGR